MSVNKGLPQCPARFNRMTVFAAVAVMLSAIGLRLSSCYESLWLDELHTAWCIWGNFGDVSSRAANGNQTPLYFQLMWFWKQVFGGSELALRLSSVLPVALAAAISVLGVTQLTGRLSAGLLAGLLLSVETNSLFFGTEFRPYAWIMLLCVVAAWACLAMTRATDSLRRARLRMVVVVSVCCAVLFHPTSGVVLGILVATTAAVVATTKRGSTTELAPSGDRRFDGISVVIIIVSVVALLDSSLSESWQRRGQWKAFGQATTWMQIWQIWDWVALLVVPVSVASAGFAVRVRFGQWRATEGWRMAGICLTGGVVGTSVFFFASYFDVVPLWHRRYFVAALPLLVWGASILFGICLPRVSGWVGRSAVAVGVLGIVGFTIWHQGSDRYVNGPNPVFVTRGENWRDAVAWANSQKASQDWVWIDSGLIESGVLHDPASDTESREQIAGSDYLAYPIVGPYRINVAGRSQGTRGNLAVVSPVMNPAWFAVQGIHSRLTGRRDAWLITRSPVYHWKRLMQQQFPAGWDQATYRQFGRVAVIRLPME